MHSYPNLVGEPIIEDARHNTSLSPLRPGRAANQHRSESARHETEHSDRAAVGEEKQDHFVSYCCLRERTGPFCQLQKIFCSNINPARMAVFDGGAWQHDYKKGLNNGSETLQCN